MNLKTFKAKFIRKIKCFGFGICHSSQQKVIVPPRASLRSLITVRPYWPLLKKLFRIVDETLNFINCASCYGPNPENGIFLVLSGSFELLSYCKDARYT